MLRVFISHSHQDKEMARRVAEYLEANSTRVWLDENEILVGDSIPAKIEQGIVDSDFVVVLLSKASVTSGWVKREVETKLMTEITTGTIAVLSVLCEGPDGSWHIPPLLATKRYADISGSFEAGMLELLRAISGHSGAYHVSVAFNHYECYVFGFTIAKIAWFHGSPLTLASLKSQFRTLVSKLSVDSAIAEGVMSLFDWKGDPRDVMLRNAKQGLEGRQVLSSELLLRRGEVSAASFRFGFNIIYVALQLEFLELAQANRSQETREEDLLQGLTAQFENLLSDGAKMGLESAYLEALGSVQSLANEGAAAAARNQLIEIGSRLEQRFRQ